MRIHVRSFTLAGLLLLLPALATPQTCVSPPAGLLGWWTGDGSTLDLTSQNPPGILVNGAGYGPGLVAQSFALDGVDDWVDLGTQTGDFGSSDFTVDLWVRFDDLAGEQILIEKYVEVFSPASTGWTLTKLPSGQVGLFNFNTAFCVNPNAFTVPGVWHFVAVTRSGSSFSIFVDGSFQDSRTFSFPLASGASLKLGHRGNPVDTPGSLDTRDFYLRGAIDEVEIFDRALGALELYGIYLAGPAGKCKDQITRASGTAWGSLKIRYR